MLEEAVRRASAIHRPGSPVWCSPALFSMLSFAAIVVLIKTRCAAGRGRVSLATVRFIMGGRKAVRLFAQSIEKDECTFSRNSQNIGCAIAVDVHSGDLRANAGIIVDQVWNELDTAVAAL